MPKLKLKKENKDVVDGWMGTYGDMVTLLMAFFVMLYSASDPDPGKYEEIVESMKEAFSKQDVENEFKELHESLEDIIEKKNLENAVEIKLGPNGILIQIPGSSLFASGSADIMTDMAPVIVEISTAITQLLDQSSYHDYMIEVEGHTDDEPIGEDSEIFSSNWDLSAIRATGIVELLYNSGIEMDKLKPIARAESIPLLPNRDENGIPIPENRAKNRRVVIKVNKFK
jgi:chemotaxis protein MotB